MTMSKRSFFPSLSTRKDRSAEANALSETLKTHEWERTFVWSDQDGKGPDEQARIAVAELEACAKLTH